MSVNKQISQVRVNPQKNTLKNFQNTSRPSNHKQPQLKKWNSSSKVNQEKKEQTKESKKSQQMSSQQQEIASQQSDSQMTAGKKPQTLTKPKPPLQASPKHRLHKITMTPNISKLKYIQYEHKSLFAFSLYDIQSLDQFDLEGIHSIAIDNKEMQDETLRQLTQLHLPKLKSLRIDGNLITDIRCLKNFDLTRFENLDISENPLNAQSAQFLATFPFDNLIYLTVSFDTGFDQQCWLKILENKLRNFPKLQALDICNENLLGPQIKKVIQECLIQKAEEQKRISRQKGQQKYPQNYKIKLSWNVSKQIYDTYDPDKILDICQKWAKSVKFDRVLLPTLVLKKTTQKSNKSSKSSGSSVDQNSSKIKKIKKIRKDQEHVQKNHN